MASLEQIAENLPNGFHDALVSSCRLDFVNRIAEFELSIWVGNFEAHDLGEREAHRAARLVLDGVLFCQIEAPDARYAFSEPGPLTVDLCGADSSHPLAGTIPLEAFFSRFFVARWNAFIHVAAMRAELAWSDDLAVGSGRA